MNKDLWKKQLIMQKISKATTKRVLYPTNITKTSVVKVPVLGGEPITLEQAIELRTAIFGDASTFGGIEADWVGHSFAFNTPETPKGYSLQVLKAGTRGFIMCVQGYILKHLLFQRRGPKHQGDPKLLLMATAKGQEDALVAALADILWKAGERQRAFLCCTQENVYLNDSPDYSADGVTEKIHIFEFKKIDELAFNLKKYLYEFFPPEGGHGIFLFLYSLILSRGIKRLEEDMGIGEVPIPLVQHNGCLHPSLAHLILVGKAIMYLHNGIVYDGDEYEMSKPKTGLLTRGEVGLLVWTADENKRQTVGSRLKTPTLPVWVTRTDDQYGILFNPSRELTRDYHAENRFDLHYYSGTEENSEITIITINTRVQASREESSPLEHTIHTKWAGADIEWNGTEPCL